jgi:hypothetical protein
MKRASRWFHYTDILWCTVRKTSKPSDVALELSNKKIQGNCAQNVVVCGFSTHYRLCQKKTCSLNGKINTLGIECVHYPYIKGIFELTSIIVIILYIRYFIHVNLLALLHMFNHSELFISHTKRVVQSTWKRKGLGKLLQYSQEW